MRAWLWAGLLALCLDHTAALARAQDAPSSGTAQNEGAVVQQKLTRKAPPKDDLFRDPQKLIRFASQIEAKGDPEKALRFTEDALAVDPKYRPALAMAARLSLLLSQPQALARARAYAAAAPRVAGAQLLLADALLFEMETQDVPRLLDKARSLGASSSDMALRAGKLQDLEGRPKAAQDIYASALAKTPDQPALMLAMALSLTLSGDEAAGLQLAQKLANMPAGDTPVTHAAIARIYAAASEVEIAVRIMQAQLDKEEAEAMRPFLARIGQLNARDKALALHYSRISREALRATITEKETALADELVQVEDGSQVRIHRGKGGIETSPDMGPAPPQARYYVQLASMRALSGLATIWAQVQKNAPDLPALGPPWVAQVEGQYRLLIGPYPNLAAARQSVARLQAHAVRAMPRLIDAQIRVEEMKP